MRSGLIPALGQTAYGLYAWLAFAAVTVPTLVVIAVTPGEERRRRLARAGARAIFRLMGVRLKVDGLERLPGEPCVVVANHASYLDGVILTAVLPARFGFVIKREMTKVPGAHLLLRRLGSQFVERGEANRRSTDARRILRMATSQQSLAFFPEGTFRAEPGLRPFHNGAFQAAIRGNKPIAPIVIHGSRRMLPSGRWLPRPGELRVVIDDPITWNDDAPSARSLMTLSRKQILKELGEPDLQHLRQT